MDLKFKVPDFGRKFGFAKVEWQIKNFFTQTCREDWLISSPEFSIRGSGLTKWRLHLQGRHLLEKHAACALLERSEYDTFPPVVQVNWKLVFTYCSKYFSAESIYDFKKKTMDFMEIENFEALEDRLYNIGCSTLVVHCLMMVYNKDSSKFPRSKNTSLKSLSQDMCAVYSLMEHSDVVVHARTSEIKAHRAVLCSRNETFKYEVDDSEDLEIHLHTLEWDATRRVFAYLYTGDLDYVLRTPSFALDDCISYYNIKELEEHYTYDEMTLCTRFEKQEYCFSWVVKDVTLRNEICITSSPFGKRFTNMTFQLHLFTKGFDGKNEYMSLFIETADDCCPDYLFVEFAIADIRQGYRNFRKLRFASKTDKMAGIEDFVKVDVLKSDYVACSGMINILCHIHIPKDCQSQYIVRSKTHCNVSIETEALYQLLSSKISLLFETGEYSDFTIVCGETRFKVHQFILSGRSHILKKIMCGRGFVSISDIEPDVLRFVLSYLYSGILKNCEFSNAVKIYAAAERFFILPLKYECSRILQESIDMQNILEVMDLATKNKDYKLKASACKFISDNLETVIHKIEEPPTILLSTHLLTDLAKILRNCANLNSKILRDFTRRIFSNAQYTD